MYGRVPSNAMQRSIQLINKSGELNTYRALGVIDENLNSRYQYQIIF